MRLILVAAAFAIVISPARAQLIGQPSGQGGAPPSSPAAPTTAPSVLTTPSQSQYQGTTSPPANLNNVVQPPALQGREQPEQPAGPLR